MESCRLRVLQNSRLRRRTDVAELSNLVMAQSGRRSWLQGAAVVELALSVLKKVVLDQRVGLDRWESTAD